MPRKVTNRKKSGKSRKKNPVRMRPVALPLDTRSMTVLGGLALSMILVAGLLLVLEPRPRAPIGGPILTVLEPGLNSPDIAMRDVAAIAERGRWQGIVIHHSGQTFGRVDDISRLHQSYGYGGLGYHFVIGNGDGEPDGEVLVGYRWTQQLKGQHIPATGPAADWYNGQAIGICLIGDGDRSAPTAQQMRQLTRLVKALQQELGISADRVYMMSQLSTGTTSPGKLFPTESFRSELHGANRPS